jgi:hypothetical protein
MRPDGRYGSRDERARQIRPSNANQVIILLQAMMANCVSYITSVNRTTEWEVNYPSLPAGLSLVALHSFDYAEIHINLARRSYSAHVRSVERRPSIEHMELSMTTHRHPCAGLPAAAQKAFDRIARGLTPKSRRSVQLLVDLALVRSVTDGDQTRYAVPGKVLLRWMDWYSFSKRQPKSEHPCSHRHDARQMDFWPITTI